MLIDCDYGCGIIRKGTAPASRHWDELEDQWTVARQEPENALNFVTTHKRELLNLETPYEFLRHHFRLAAAVSHALLKQVRQSHMRTLNSILRYLLPKRSKAQASNFTENLRPDSIDLIGQSFDRVFAAPATKTLIICSAPRTGSYELCRFLTAAGLGIPHEYFHPVFAQELASRWRIEGNPLGNSLGTYIDRLRQTRAANDVFSFKLQYWQFNEFLRNASGASLFRDAHILHLYRSNITAQLASYHLARRSGVWDYTIRPTTEPQPLQSTDLVVEQLAALTWEDTGFRRLFAMMSVNPMFVTTEGLFEDPRAVLQRLARQLDVEIDDHALREMISKSIPYSRGHLPKDISDRLKELAFES